MLKKVLSELPELDEGKSVILSLSGGLDSTTLAQLLVHKYGKENVKAIGFDYNQRHRGIELSMAQKTADMLGIEYKILKLDYLGEITKNVSSLISDSEMTPGTIEKESTRALASTYVPFRNLQFASITAGFAEANNGQYIMLGVQSDDLYSYPDTTKGYFDILQEIFKLHRSHPITQVMPFAELTKADELVIARELTEITGESFESWSCYNGENENDIRETGLTRMCANCATCSERIVAHVKSGEDDNEIMRKFIISEFELNVIRKNI